MIALTDNPSIPHSGADDYYLVNMSKKIIAFILKTIVRYKLK